MDRPHLRPALRAAAAAALKAARSAAEKVLSPKGISPSPARPVNPASVDLSLVPPLVDGSGDTPGPNHKEKIGRTWLAAQIISGASPVILDLRPPAECVAGVLPGAIVVGSAPLVSLPSLPAKTERVVVYDQIGSPACAEAVAALQAAGWPGARWLAGGFAEWLEQGEPLGAFQG